MKRMRYIAWFPPDHLWLPQRHGARGDSASLCTISDFGERSLRILVLGATGMLGHTAFHHFTGVPGIDAWGTLRSAGDLGLFAPEHRNRLIPHVDVLGADSLIRAMERAKPDIVLNAVGVVKQLAAANDPLSVLPLNAEFPHRLAALCGLAGTRMVHVSTDCVFSGRTGGYRESDPSDAEDLYGKSKYIGEVGGSSHVITLRTSGIGHELNTSVGLLEWFLSQSGQVRGFANAIYTGLPWIEFARVIEAYVLPRPDLHGVYQVASAPISKLHLLELFAAEYTHHLEIVPDFTVKVDRSLDSSRFQEATGYVAPPWPHMIRSMRSFHAALRGRQHD